MRVGIVAAEPSGDQLAAGLMEALSRRYPDVCFEGVGGPLMKTRGLDSWYPLEKLSVMGLVEVLRHLPELLALRRDLMARWQSNPPDLFIGVDAPDFNLSLEQALKAMGVPTVHYVSPTVWAWREGRTRKLRKAADLVLCIFPFEQPILRRHGIRSEYVGHPLAAAYPLKPERSACRTGLQLDPEAPVLALLPGSRENEVKRLAPPFLEAASLLGRRVHGLQVITPLVTPGSQRMFESLCQEHAPEVPVKVVRNRSREALCAADAVLVASGTATFEALLCKRPMVVGYRMNELTYRIITGLRMLKTEHVAMANLLSEEPLAPEFLQQRCTAKNLAGALEPFFRDLELVKRIGEAYRQTHERLLVDSNALAAEAVLGLAGK